MGTTLIQIRKGDTVIYEPKNRAMEMKVIDYQLTPNGMNNPKLVCVITAMREDGFEVNATSDKFISLSEGNYIDKYQKFNTK
jgi:hypothetical protein